MNKNINVGTLDVCGNCRVGTRNGVRNGLMDIVLSYLKMYVNATGSQDQNVIDPSGFQRFCEDVGADITGVTTFFPGADSRLCRLLFLGNWALQKYFIFPEMNGFMA